MKTYLVIGAAVGLMGLGGCDNRLDVVNDFYSKHTSLEAQRAAIKGYTPEEKWHIFAYGTARGEGYALGLGETIAEDGKTIIDVVENDLGNGNPDLHYLAVAYLFGRIVEDKRYDVCGDKALLGRMEGYAEDIGDPHIKHSYQSSFYELCVPDEGATASASSAVGSAAP